ncbi:hypothetical protein Patl1_01432 [Pistacia atlantica]|uniref:Uncharacterized protein n=1 Tax=Pistacia atlantica TaxID=434234 RepID=A0ACC1CDR0_9ROSI|nr:hypothetical protein Patl1_01432 [Pistacia atlantica]
MVKKLNQASLKINKNESKKQLNNLIEVLRPKVYITDSSNFKRLVQELTGNGSSIVPSPPSPTTQQQQLQAYFLENNYVPVINVEDDRGEPQSSMEAISFDAALDSFDDELFNNICLTEGLFTELAENHQMQSLNHNKTFDASSPMEQWADCLACQDVESWLLDIDQPYPKFNGFAQNIQEVSVYDYDLSGLVSGSGPSGSF